jgi:hypothetical protein
VVWNHNTVNKRKYVDNMWIIEFSIEYNKYFSEVERKFVVIPRKRLLEEIPLWINMLFIEKGMMHMESNRMVE